MICFITTNYRREQLLDVYCRGIERLRSQTSEKIISICVGDKTDKPFDVHQEYPNNVSDKFNRAVEIARDFNPDYLCVMGSDDVFNIEVLNYSISLDSDFVNPRDVYFYNSSTGEMFYLLCSMIGCARFVRKDLLDKLDWKLWTIKRERGLDQILYRNVAMKWSNPHFYISADVGGRIIDIKSDESMNGYDKWTNMPKVDAKQILSFLSEGELSVLNKLIM